MMDALTSQLLFLLLLVSSCQTQMMKGQQCKTSGGKNGYCENVNLCKSAVEEIRQNGRPTICSFDDKTPIVCCVSTEEPGFKARKKCMEYSLPSGQAPNIEPQTNASLENVRRPKKYGGRRSIVGGSLVLRAYPHMAAIGFGEEDGISWLCGGSLISEQYVMTAAHCVSAGRRGLARWVLLGVLKLTSANETPSAQLFSVVERIRHPDFKQYSRYHDIALLKLDHKVVLSDDVSPACLQVTYDIKTKVLVASGWGLVDWADDRGSDHLMNVALPLVPTPECNKTYESLVGTRNLMFGIQDDKMMCAGQSSGGKDTCGGDSGGPLQYNAKFQSNTYTVVGVTSFGSTVCGARNSPAVYTRVSYYVPWIENIAWP